MLSRNSGCRWMEFMWNGYKVIVMENDKLRLEILLDKGTDIVEFLYKPKDVDLMWRSPIPIYKPSTFVTTSQEPSGNFIDYYPGGWQELFPNGGGLCQYKGATLGHHGEVALIPWKYELIEDTVEKISVKFFTETYRTPFFIEKTITLEKGQSELSISEKITNYSEDEMDFIWGHHPAFGAPFLSSDCVINLKGANVSVRKGDGVASTNLKQTTGIWPFVEGINGEKVDISICPAYSDKVSDVIYLSELKEGRYEIINKKLQLKFWMEFPLSTFRYLWFWRVAGGSYGYPWYGRTYNIALEPVSSLPILTEAVNRGDQLTLKAGASLEAMIKAGISDESVV
jgi:galactose mutarotase-like enzyme